MKEKLELLSLANEFEIIKDEKENYQILDKQSNLYGWIFPDVNVIEYYIGGNCYGDDSLIDIQRLEKLKSFCEFLMK